MTTGEEWQKITNVDSAVKTGELGESLGRKLKLGDIVLLFGDLGAGKTTFIQGLAKGLGVENFVTSPSFVIANEYHLQSGSFYHVDLYRMNDIDSITDIGIEDMLNNDSIIAVEWAEKAESLFPSSAIKVFFEVITESERKIIIKGSFV